MVQFGAKPVRLFCGKGPRPEESRYKMLPEPSNSNALHKLVAAAIAEDAPGGDITSFFFIPEKASSVAEIVAKASGIFAGEAVLKAVCDVVSGPISLHLYVSDGSPVKSGDVICRLEGPTRQLLLLERVTLNFLQRLSGVATQTRQFVDAIKGTAAHILDTRKTTPLFRALEKAAVVAGGGVNHRDGLSDMILMKENHLSAMAAAGTLGQLRPLMQKAKQQFPGIKIEIEIETMDQLNTWDLSAADYIMLDNFGFETLPDAIAFIRARFPRAQVEISGNVTLQNVREYALLGVDRISIGSLTHSVNALDLSMLFRSR